MNQINQKLIQIEKHKAFSNVYTESEKEAFNQLTDAEQIRALIRSNEETKHFSNDI